MNKSRIVAIPQKAIKKRKKLVVIPLSREITANHHSIVKQCLWQIQRNIPCNSQKSLPKENRHSAGEQSHLIMSSSPSGPVSVGSEFGQRALVAHPSARLRSKTGRRSPRRHSCRRSTHIRIRLRGVVAAIAIVVASIQQSGSS